MDEAKGFIGSGMRSLNNENSERTPGKETGSYGSSPGCTLCCCAYQGSFWATSR